MTLKIAYYTQMAEEAARQVTGSREQWTSFLTTAARLYKYPFPEQLMIFIQRPDATACAEYDLWNNKMRRFVKRGSKGIALVDNSGEEPRLRYVFDVSDTGARKNSRLVHLWQMQEEHLLAVMQAFAESFGIDGTGMQLEDQIFLAAEKLAEEYWSEHSRQIIDIVEDSYLEGYDEYNIETSFRSAAATSIAYTLYTRTVGDADSYFDQEDFLDILNFNTQAASNVLGTAVSEGSARMFLEIEKTIRSYERNKETERSHLDDRSNLQTEWGLFHSGDSAGVGRKEKAGQVRENAQSVPQGEQHTPVQSSGSNREAIPTPVGDSGYSDRQNETADDTAFSPESGAGQENGSAGLDAAHEYAESPGGGNHPDRAYQQLNIFSMFPSEEKQIETIDEAAAVLALMAESDKPSAFSISEEELDKVLQYGSGFEGGEPHMPISTHVYPTTRENSLEEQELSDVEADGSPAINTEQVSESVPVQNFHITELHLGEGGPKQKFRANMNAIYMLQMLEKENRNAASEEQETLSRYVGWGGLADAFDERKGNWIVEYQELKAALTQEEYAAARASTLNAHYTSPVVIKAIYEAVVNLGFDHGNVLEPSMGVGNFFGLLPESMSESRLYGVELDSITGRIAQKLYPNAEITVAGFETTDRRDFYDLAVGNVPFGNYQVSDKPYDKLRFSIHNYFFAKALDQVRPGGVIAFVTSRYTMDAKHSDARQYLAQRAHLLGAIRLPNNAFRANAGTDVVSDIIFLQRREHPIDISPDWVHLGQMPDGLAMNRYFIEHPEMVLGEISTESTQFGKQELTVNPIEDARLSEQLHEAVQNIQGSYQPLELAEATDLTRVYDTIAADPNVKNFSYAVVEGKIYFRENSIMRHVELSQTAAGRVKGMVELRTIVGELMNYQLEDYPDEEIRIKQRELNTSYDRFLESYGLINSRANAQTFDEDSSYYLLCSLENIDENGKLESKADMFTKRTIRPERCISSVDTPAEALAVSIGERGKVELSYMAELLGTPREYDHITKELQGVIFKDPMASRELESGWQTADEYLSGNVREKLWLAQMATQTDPQFGVNVDALKKAQPKDLEASEIDVRLGATWIDKDYIQQFMEETFQPPFYLRRGIEVKFSPITAEWQITGKRTPSRNDVHAYITYGTSHANAYRILEDTLNLRDIRIYDTIEDMEGKQKRVLNKKETTLAQQKQQAIKNTFRDWVWHDPHRREALVMRYNELFNSIRPREYDGSHIRFVGMNPEIKLREHQKSAIAHVLYGGNTLLAHEVGAGKTFEMAAAAMEAKRLGLCQKSLFVVPNHLTLQWANEFLHLYPGANLLVASKKDFETANRKKFCARIATGDYDAVIIGHSQFERIPISPERQERLLEEQIDEIEAAISELKYQRGEGFSIKQMEKTRKSLQARLDKLLANDRKDDVITFEQLGIDRLFVDEAHSFKNLFLYTKMRNVAGLSTSEAQKSSDMFMKCQYMDELTGGRGIIFATGTPVSNSMNVRP